MRILLCDKCEKEIKHDSAVVAGVGWKTVELCDGCGAPVVDFLRKHYLVDAKAARQLQK